MCYKANLDGCAMETYTYTNSSIFLNPFAPSQPSYMNPYLFTRAGSPRPGEQFFLADVRPVTTVRQCERHCDQLTGCRGYVAQAPSLDYALSMKCSLLTMQSSDDRTVSAAQDNTHIRPVSDYRTILGDGHNSLAEDSRWAPFVVAIRKDVFPQ